MARTKYFYNPETCKYEKVKIRPRDYLYNILVVLVASLTFAVVITSIYNYYFDTSSEAQLRRVNNELDIHLVTLKESLDEINETIALLKQRDDEIFMEIYEAKPDNTKLEIKSSLNSVIDSFYVKGLDNREAVNKFKAKLSNLHLETYKNILHTKKLASESEDKRLRFEYIPTIQPIENHQLTALASGYGKRVNPYHHGVVFHEGIDFSAPVGTPVFATAKGKVSTVKNKDSETGYGRFIEIEHNGLTTKYAHLSEILVKKGKTVEKGQIIGYVGKSGGTIAPCIHYEIIKEGRKINPVNFMIEDLSEKDYLKLLELSLRKGKSMD